MTLTHDGIETVANPDAHSHDVCPRCAVYERDVFELQLSIKRQIELLNIVVDNVKPALDGIANSPLGKMFGMEPTQ